MFHKIGLRKAIFCRKFFESIASKKKQPVAIDTNGEQSVDKVAKGTESASSVTNNDQRADTVTVIPACEASATSVEAVPTNRMARPTSEAVVPTNRMARPTSVATNGKDVPFSSESSRPSSQAANNEESLRKRRKQKANIFFYFLIKNFHCSLLKMLNIE
jgi:hypothetical protein